MRSTLDIKIQKAVISIANAFTEYNLKRYNFLQSTEAFMDCVGNSIDKVFIHEGEFINFERDYRTAPFNEEIIVDLSDMEEKNHRVNKIQKNSLLGV